MINALATMLRGIIAESTASGESSCLDVESAKRTANVLTHVAQYCKRWSNVIDRSLKTARDAADKEIHGLCKIVRWDLSNFDSMRDSLKRSHYQLAKIVRRFDVALQEQTDRVLSAALQGHLEKRAPVKALELKSEDFVEMSDEELKSFFQNKGRDRSQDGYEESRFQLRISDSEEFWAQKHCEVAPAVTAAILRLSGKRVVQNLLEVKQPKSGEEIRNGLETGKDIVASVNGVLETLRNQELPLPQKKRQLVGLKDELKACGIKAKAFAGDMSQLAELFASDVLDAGSSKFCFRTEESRKAWATCEKNLYSAMHTFLRLRSRKELPPDLSGAEYQKYVGLAVECMALLKKHRDRCVEFASSAKYLAQFAKFSAQKHVFPVAKCDLPEVLAGQKELAERMRQQAFYRMVIGGDVEESLALRDKAQSVAQTLGESVEYEMFYEGMDPGSKLDRGVPVLVGKDVLDALRTCRDASGRVGFGGGNEDESRAGSETSNIMRRSMLCLQQCVKALEKDASLSRRAVRAVAKDEELKRTGAMALAEEAEEGEADDKDNTPLCARFDTMRPLVEILPLDKLSAEVRSCLEDSGGIQNMEWSSEDLYTKTLHYAVPAVRQISLVAEALQLSAMQTLGGLSEITTAVLELITFLFEHGYNRKSDAEDGEGDGEGEGAHDWNEGTGLGAGEGARDVTDQIEDEAQMEGLKGEEQNPDTEVPEGEDNAMEVGFDLDGEAQNQPKKKEEEQEQGSDDEKEDDPENKDMDREMGDVDLNDGGELDDKMWNGDDEDDKGEEDKKEQDGKEQKEDIEADGGKEQEGEKEMVGKEEEESKKKDDKKEEQGKKDEKKEEGEKGEEKPEEADGDGEEGEKKEEEDGKEDEDENAADDAEEEKNQFEARVKGHGIEEEKEDDGKEDDDMNLDENMKMDEDGDEKEDEEKDDDKAEGKEEDPDSKPDDGEKEEGDEKEGDDAEKADDDDNNPESDPAAAEKDEENTPEDAQKDEDKKDEEGPTEETAESPKEEDEKGDEEDGEKKEDEDPLKTEGDDGKDEEKDQQPENVENPENPNQAPDQENPDEKQEGEEEGKEEEEERLKKDEDAENPKEQHVGQSADDGQAAPMEMDDENATGDRADAQQQQGDNASAQQDAKSSQTNQQQDQQQQENKSSKRQREPQKEEKNGAEEQDESERKLRKLDIVDKQEDENADQAKHDENAPEEQDPDAKGLHELDADATMEGVGETNEMDESMKDEMRNVVLEEEEEKMDAENVDESNPDDENSPDDDPEKKQSGANKEMAPQSKNPENQDIVDGENMEAAGQPNCFEAGEDARFRENENAGVWSGTGDENQAKLMQEYKDLPVAVDETIAQVEDVVSLKDQTMLDEGKLRGLWGELESRTAAPTAALTEQLRILLEPTLRGKLQGDYKTGKRISMRKVIPFIASSYRRDKIWLRRTKPSKREYQMILCVDNSVSMQECGAGPLALEALTILCTALARVEAGEFAITTFGGSKPQILYPLGGQQHSPVLSEFSVQGSSSSSASQFTVQNLNTSFGFEEAKPVLQHLSFNEESSTSHDKGLSGVMNLAMRMFEERAGCNAKQMMLIVTDGRFNKQNVRAQVHMAISRRILPLIVVCDQVAGDAPAGPQASSSSSNNSSNGAKKARGKSIFDVKSMVVENGEMKVKGYMNDFPFPFYTVIQDIQALPQLFSDVVRQWLEMNQ